MLITDGSLRPPSHQPRGQFVGHNRKTCSPTGCRDLWLLGKMLSVTSWWVIVEKEVCSTGLKIFVWSLWLWAGCCGHQRQQFVCKQPNYSPSVRETVKNVLQSQNGDCSPCCSFWKLLLTPVRHNFYFYFLVTRSVWQLWQAEPWSECIVVPNTSEERRSMNFIGFSCSPVFYLFLIILYMWSVRMQSCQA